MKLTGDAKRKHGEKAWFAAFSPMLVGYAAMTAPRDAPATRCRLSTLWEKEDTVYEVRCCFLQTDEDTGRTL